MSKLKSFWEQFQPHPFRKLLFLEWLLLGTIAVIIPLETFSWEIFAKALQLPDQFVANGIKMLVMLLTLLLFGLLGIRLPTTRLSKTIYIAIEFALFGFASFLLTWNTTRLTALLVIIIIRSCLLFSTQGRWWMLGLTSLVYLLVQLPAGLLAIATLFINEQTLAAFKGNWTWGWGRGEIFSDGRMTLNLEIQPEQVRSFVVAGRSTVFQFYITEIATFGLVALFVVLLVNALLAERQGRKKLAIAHEQLYQYSCQIEDQATLQERNRIARDLHDSLGHLLTAQNIQLQNAALHTSETAQGFLVSGINIGTQALTELRQTLNQLRDHPFAARSFYESMMDLIQGFQRMMPTIDLTYNVQNIDLAPNRVQIAIYRITEEALMNVYKHSQAQQVQIQISELNHESDRQMGRCIIMLTIADNGQGFEMSQIPTGYGLRGIRERAESIGGKLTIESQPQQGCQIQIIIPFVEEDRS